MHRITTPLANLGTVCSRSVRAIFQDIHTLLFCIALALFVIFKWSHLPLPYCWDEANFYGPAVKIMHENGASLSPQALPIYYSRGHPLLFHFLGALWMNLFGSSIVSSHLFALSISLVLLISLYALCRKVFSPATGLAAVLIIMVQPMFLAQSGLVLPEILLALFMITALFAHLLGYKILYWCAAALSIMTKETAIVLFAAIPFYELLLFLGTKEKNYFQFFKKIIFVVSPVMVWLLFLLWQKLLQGWFFFPEHTGYIDFSPAEIRSKLTRILLVIYVWSGRNIISLLLAGLVVWAMITKKKEVFRKTGPYLLLFGIFSIFFMLVSAVNFLTDRYLLSLIFLLVIMGACFIHELILPRSLAWLVVSALLVMGIYYSITLRDDCDSNLGYVNIGEKILESQRNKEEAEK